MIQYLDLHPTCRAMKQFAAKGAGYDSQRPRTLLCMVGGDFGFPSSYQCSHDHTSACSNDFSHFQIPTKSIGKLNLARRLALHFEQIWICDQHSEALCSRRCNVQSVRTVEKFHASRSIL